ncbi:MAG TPA: hypothetical protein VHE55_01825 [Fimbriimonadaceae bacterium]|nr:hypothetical protein [Fimbriimonadaceae bacterium]
METAESGTRPRRLGAFVDGVGWVEHRYGRVWQRQDDHLVAAPDRDQVGLILRLSEELAEPFRVFYVLLVPRDDEEDEGRFELTQCLARGDLAAFLRRYRELFENDGRHHLWIVSPTTNSSIVYDQHNVLYLHGPLDRFARSLGEAGLTEGQVVFPSPHSHHYHQELDSMVDDMLARYEWRRSPLSG